MPKLATEWVEDDRHEVEEDTGTMVEDRGCPAAVEAYYDGVRTCYWIQGSGGEWITVNETGLKRYLRAGGLSALPTPGALLSPIDEEILRIQRSRNIAYAGELAGYKSGLHEILKSRVLVTRSVELIEPVEGDCRTIISLLEGMLGGDDMRQVVCFLGWLKIALEALRSRRRRPGQALVIAGPSNCGKSLVQKLITLIFGGRMAKPFQYMLGVTPFNSHLFGAEHLVIEDEAASTDIRKRREFGAHLKEITVNDCQSCHPKGRQPVSLTPFWRLTITVNDEPENLVVLPPIDASMRDKVIMLKARANSMPMPTTTDEERDRFWQQLITELPAFMKAVLDFEIPAESQCPRFGIKHYHHPDLVRAIDELAPEFRMLSLIDGGGLFSGPLEDPWEGSAAQLEQVLRDASGAIGDEIRRLLHYNTACGVYLGRLASSHPRRVTKRVLHGRTKWCITAPPDEGEG